MAGTLGPIIGLVDVPPPPKPKPERRNTRASARAHETVERTDSMIFRSAAQIEAYPAGKLGKMLRWDPGSYTGASSVIHARQLNQEAARVQALCGELARRPNSTRCRRRAITQPRCQRTTPPVRSSTRSPHFASLLQRASSRTGTLPTPRRASRRRAPSYPSTARSRSRRRARARRARA